MSFSYACKVYFFTHFIYGMVFNVLGPLVPFLAEKSNVPQSEFTYVFALRGLGYVIAGLGQKTFLAKYHIHDKMFWGCAGSGLGLLLFSVYYDSIFMSSIAALSMNLALGVIEVTINICLVNAGPDTKRYMTYSYLFYSIGGAIGPLSVSLIGTYSIQVLGVSLSIVSLAYYSLALPSQEQRTGIQQVLGPEKKTEQFFIRSRTEIYFCILFVIYASVSLSLRSWLPSFAVMQDMATKQEAALSISVYSLVVTVFRFVFMIINLQTVVLLTWATNSLVVIMGLGLACFYMQFNTLLLFGMPALMGIVFSSYFPYLFALPSQYGQKLSAENTTNATISYAIGEAVISAAIGYSMQLVAPVMLLISMLVLSVINRVSFGLAIINLVQALKDQQTEDYERSIEMDQKRVSI